MKRLFLIFGVVILAGCQPTVKTSISSDGEYQAALRKAQTLSEGSLSRFAAGEMMTAEDKNHLIQADGIFKDMIEYAPDVWSNYLGAAKIRIALGDDAAALKRLQDADRYLPSPVPDNPGIKVLLSEIYREKAELLVRAQKFYEAEVAIEQGLKFAQSGDLFATQAGVYLQLKDKPAAETSIRQGLALQPGHHRLLALQKLLRS